MYTPPSKSLKAYYLSKPFVDCVFTHMSPFAYSSYYAPSSLPYPDQLPPPHYYHQDYSISQHDLSMSHHDQSMSHSQSMQPPPSPSIPIDPALALYPPYYNYHQPQHHIPQHLSLPPNYSSPSSQGSDTLGTPPTEHMYPSSSANMNGKRPASSISNGTVDSRKKSRKDEESDAHSPSADKEETKAKPTRGSRLVVNIHHLTYC